ENARLFKELEARNQDLIVTAEILQVISRSPTDLQPVFDTIVRNAANVCGAFDAILALADGDDFVTPAHHGPIPRPPIRFSMRGTVTGLAIREARTVHVADLLASENFPTGRDLARTIGYRTVLCVPLLRHGAAIGAIGIRRTEVRPFTETEMALLQTFADQAVIAIENVRLFKELEAKNRDLTEAVDQQTATAEILRVISSSPTDLQPVFAAVLDHALTLCEASNGSIYQFEDGALRHVGLRGPHLGIEVGGVFPLESSPGRAILEKRTIHLEDILQELDWHAPEVQAGVQRAGLRTIVAVPLLREETAIGAIVIRRLEVRPFSEKQIRLLKTFADQAVIAIENVRLFTELQGKNKALTEAHAQVSESLEQQTATSEILRVISQSLTDIQPVLDAVAASAARLCEAFDAAIWRRDGDRVLLAAHHGPMPEEPIGKFTLPLVGSFVGRSVLDARTIHSCDVQAEVDKFPATSQHARRIGFRAVLCVPLMREGVAIGSIALRRREAELFTDRQVALLQTFADQAVIAIENVRLFTELQEKNQALTQAHTQVTESLEQQTATAEVLKVISRSTFDLQPVLDTLIENAVRLCGADRGFIHRQDGEFYPVAASYGHTPEWLDVVKRNPIRLDRTSATGRAAIERRVIHVPDILADPEYQWAENQRGQEQMHRTILSVPMLRDGTVIGVITIRRPYVQPFTDKQVELLTTFAAQGVIAIENARLLSELQARTTELTRSVEELRALGEVGQAISSTLNLDTVLSTIVSRAVQLSGTDGGSVYEYDEATEEFSLRASRDLPEAYVEQVRDTRPRRGEGAVGRVAQTREPVQIADISDATAYESRVRNTLLQIGLRALLAVPLIAEGQLVGALIVMRKRTGTFAAEEVALLQTFATQSALAIQNARLFREIEEKSRQLEVASQHKSEFLANMSHELRTPLNAIIGFSEVLTDRMFGELNEKQEEYLKDIYASGTHLLSLINDILDLSKIEAGRMELELTEFHLPTAIESALMLVRERAGRRSLTLQTSIDDRVGQIQADERKVRQVVLNLLSNSIKFTPEGGRIEVAAVPRDGFVEISVNDTGIGIAPEDQEKVFEEFRQVGTTAKKIEGTGLGLTLCRKFVQLHGGKIWVKSELGVGSTFAFSLPLRSA
ncbi:MAG TPA: GAF domain-containing protein, partial [Terriglobales bacterium]|nr:GAF domain-containing protein [Terriglobales bacterium]